MKKRNRCFVLLGFFIFITTITNGFSWGDHHSIGGHRHRGKRGHHTCRHSYTNHQGKISLPTVGNSEYKQQCGACHMAYPPELLPSASWRKVVSRLNDHFGEQLEIDPEVKKVIIEYLNTNAADNCNTGLGTRIMRCLGNRTPLRITEIPYIRARHREITSNCSTCHK